MERSRLKNIIILILALMNILLFGTLANTHMQENAAQNRLASQMTATFQSSGISLSADSIPSELPPAAQTLSRNKSEEKQIAEFLLGGKLSADNEGGGIISYTNSNGMATFRSGGGFDITGHLGSSKIRDICREFCRTYGYEDLNLSIEKGRGSGSATQYYGDYRIVNCTVSFLIQDGSLISVSGTRVPKAAARSKNVDSMSAATALTRFLEVHRESGAVVSRIEKISAVYELQSSAAKPLNLTPVWRITTDTGIYDVNCATGAVSQR